MGYIIHAGDKPYLTGDPLPDVDDRTQAADLSPYTWVCTMRDRGSYTELFVISGTISGSSLGVLTITPDATGLSNIAAMTTGKYVIRARGTSGSQIHTWEDSFDVQN